MPKGGYRFRAGRHRQHDRAENCRSIDVRQFHREGALIPGTWTWSWRDPETLEEQSSITVDAALSHVTLRYTIRDQAIAEHVPILRTACALGGGRPWFACPQCQGRMAILYIRGPRFACRKCHGLVYQSQSASAMASAFEKLRTLEEQLGDGWEKPKHMHFRTCLRLQERAYQAAKIANALTTMHTNKLFDQLEDMGLLDDAGRAWKAKNTNQP